MSSSPSAPWRLCVAPMIDVTDRHCRVFHRLLAPQARLYTEMITTGALLHGDAARLLEFDAREHPVALQLGSNEPQALAQAARLGEQRGYDEINLNCGCPSDRVQQGAFGACLMATPALVADCVRAMQDAVGIPVTVKHRLGLDYEDRYEPVRDFVGLLYDTGCRVFIAHARNAVLKGLSPKQNRQIPPLRYDWVQRLKADFPAATIVLNGGLNESAQCLQWMARLDGVMLGRAAWHDPKILRTLQRAIEPAQAVLDEDAVVREFHAYACAQHALGVPLHHVLRAAIGWRSGAPGARQWRRTLSQAPALLQAAGPDVLLRAWEVARDAACEADAPYSGAERVAVAEGQSRM